MSRYQLSRIVATLAVLLSGGPGAAQAQPEAEPGYRAPRTPDGQPDISGIWTNDTLTPLERPRALGDKAFYTPEEAAAVERRGAAVRDGDNAPGRRRTRAGASLDRGYNFFWFDPRDHVVPTRPHGAGDRPGERARPDPARRRGARAPAGRGPERDVPEHEPVQPLHHARHAGVDDPERLQHRQPDLPGSRLRDHRPRDGPRTAHHPPRRPPARRPADPAVDGRRPRALGRRDRSSSRPPASPKRAGSPRTRTRGACTASPSAGN